MEPTSLRALRFMADLLEDAERTATICEDVHPWCDAKPLIEELWLLYANRLDALKETSHT